MRSAVFNPIHTAFDPCTRRRRCHVRHSRRAYRVVRKVTQMRASVNSSWGSIMLLRTAIGPNAAEPQIRNPNVEIRNNIEMRKSKRGDVLGIVCPLVLRICFGFRISTFGFFSARCAHLQKIESISCFLGVSVLLTVLLFRFQRRFS